MSYTLLLVLCPFFAIVLAVTVGVNAVMVLMIYRARRRTVHLHEVWAFFAGTHGLAFDKGDSFKFPQMTGQYIGRPVSIRIESRRIVRRSRYYTVLQTPASSVPGAQMMISRKGMQLEVPGFFVSRPAAGIGDETFRSLFAVTGNAPDQAARLATPATTTALVTEGVSHLVVIGQQVSFYIDGYVDDADRIAKLLNLLYGIAGQIA